MLLPLQAFGKTQEGQKYTNHRPLVYTDAWDLWPYVFLNDQGEPTGFNVDLLKLLCNELGISYRIRLKPTMDALTDLKTGRSDLMLGMEAPFHDEFGCYGQQVVQLFTHSMVTPKGKLPNIHTPEDVAHYHVLMHDGSFSYHLMVDHNLADSVEAVGDMREAVQRLSSENKGLIVWNTLSLKWLMNKYHTNNLELTAVDFPHGEYKFMSKDSVLLHQLDSVYAVLMSTGRLQPLMDKWFYPEKTMTRIPKWVRYVSVFVLLLVFLSSYYIITFRFRAHKIARHIARDNRRLSTILSSSKTGVWLLNLKNNTLIWTDINGQFNDREHPAEEYWSNFTPDSQERISHGIDELANSREEKTLELMLDGQLLGKETKCVLLMSVFRRSKKDGIPTTIVGMMSDRTDELRDQRKAQDNMLRYQTVFSSSMVDMYFFDAKGTLLQYNDKTCQTFRTNNKEELALRIPFRFALDDGNISLSNFTGIHVTHKLSNRLSTADDRADAAPRTMYYEQQLVPVYDDKGQLLGIFGSGRDLTEAVDFYHLLRSKVKELKTATEGITSYVNNINYVLQTSGVHLVNYSPDSHVLSIFENTNRIRHTLTQTRCLSLIDEESKRVATRLFNSMDTRNDEEVSGEFKTEIRLQDGKYLFLQFLFFPVYNDSHKIETFFGLCRDISDQKANELKLEKERAKALEIEGVKNAFLSNMSIEIRTPISIIVGTVEMFIREQGSKFEDFYIGVIKEQADRLLKLVNKILYLSRLEAHMIEIKKAPTDFASIFPAHCHMGWDEQRKESVTYTVENPYEQLVVDIDGAAVGRIIELVTENAVKFTEEGYVKTRYDYIGDRLLITIEDTGCGIAKEQQEHLFERTGTTQIGQTASTGLGLPTSRELARQMGGTISLVSDKDKGTTIWVEIPCQASVIEKRLGTK
jgi:signal transduction histidine kinase/ABC-type amino acid transport substrate-binding protein